MASDRPTTPIGTAGRRAALKVARAVPLGPLAGLPGGVGEAGAKAAILRAKFQLDSDDPAGALTSLAHLTDGQRTTPVHIMAATALLELGRDAEAAAEALAASEGTKIPAEAVLVGLRAARRLEDSDLEEQFHRAAARAVPRTTREADRLAVAFKSTDPEIVDDFVTAARQWTVEHRRMAVESIPVSARLARIEDPAQAHAAVIEEGRRSAAGLRAATSALTEAGDWDTLADLIRVAPASWIAAFAPSRVRVAAAKARKAGHLEACATFCEALIRTYPGEEEARELHRLVTDQIIIARAGWPADEPAPTPAYQPRHRAVLSVLAQSLPHRSGGYATRSHGIITGLRDRGWDMTAATRLGFPYDRWPETRTDEVEPFDDIDGVRYTRLLEPGERTYDNTPMASYIERFASRIEEQARAHEASLIHASSFQNNGLAGLRAARRLGIPFVYEMRGLEDLMKISRDPSFGATSSYTYMTSLETHIAQQADLTFVITEALREEMIRRGAPADRLVVLPNGVHTAQFEPREPDAALVAELGLEGKMVIGYAGGLVDYEGLDLLLEAAAILKAERSDFAVIVVGDGHMSRKLNKLADSLDVNDVVTFTGRVPHSEVARYLSVFQVTPFPRLPLPVCELISPIKPFESMAMGKAVISSSVAALTEIVKPDERGLVFEKGSAQSLADALRRYLDDPSLREQHGRQAREWVLAERDWSDICAIVDNAYHRVLGG